VHRVRCFQGAGKLRAHTGQIVMLTKRLTGSDMAFYDFSAGTPRHDWQSPQ